MSTQEWASTQEIDEGPFGPLRVSSAKRMEGTLPTPVTQLLRSWRSGDQEARDLLVPAVYGELQRLARRELRRERQGQTLQTSDLVHEAYMRLVDADVPWQDRAHFFALAARTMRRVLVDHARAKQRHKRGAGVTHFPLADDDAVEGPSAPDVLMVDRALGRLGEVDENMERLVELHFFGGLTYQEMAVATELSEATVHRQLKLAKAWLRRELAGAEGESDGKSSR